jgi:hypothetical protein
LQPPKTAHNLKRWRNSVVGVYRRGFCPDTGMWSLSDEHVATLDSFAWLSDIDATLRGCATQESGAGQASIETESKNVLAIAALCEMVHSDAALAAKAHYMQYHAFLQRYREYHQPFGSAIEEGEAPIEESPVDAPVQVQEAPVAAEPPTAEQESAKRPVSELLAGADTQDPETPAAEAAKRQRVVAGEPSDQDDPVMDAAMAAMLATVEDDDDAASTSSSGSDVDAPMHKDPLDGEACEKYVAAVLKTVQAGETALPLVVDMIERATAAATEGADDPTDTEAIRLAARADLVTQHTFRQMLFTVSQMIAIACDSGYHTGENNETFEAVRNDWCHVVFGDGPFRVEFTDEGGCDLYLARINKETKVQDYSQDIAKHSPDLASLLRLYHPIAEAVAPAGETAAPVVCVCDGTQQHRIGGMLAKHDDAAHCGFDDGQLTTRRKAWQRKHSVKSSAKPRHVLMQLRNGTPEDRADADRRRGSRNRNYGTGNCAQGAAAAAAASMGCV